MILSMEYLSKTIFAALGAEPTDDKMFLDIRNFYIWNGTVSTDSSPLYITYASQLNSIDFSISDSPWAFICIQDVPVNKSILEQENVHLLLLPKDASLPDTVNAATEIFANTRNSLQQLYKFLTEAAHLDTPGSLSAKISEMIAAPVALVDENYHVLSSTPYNLSESVWNKHMDMKQKQFAHLPQKYNFEGFSVIPLQHPVGEYEFEVIFPIYADNSTKVIEGGIYFLSRELSYPTSFADVLRFTAQTLSWVFWRHIRQSKASPAAQNHGVVRLLIDMLYGTIPPDAEIKQTVMTSTYNLKQDFVLLIIEASAVGNTSLEKLISVFSNVFPDTLTLCFSGDIIILLPARYQDPDLYGNLWTVYSEKLKQYNAYSGISTVFNSIDRYFLHHYVRALSAARVAGSTENEKHYAFYIDESIFDIISNGPPPYNLKALCDPALLKMVDHDNKYGTEYFHTLACYWQLDRDNNRICDYMHIHKNTLYYRISKIKSFLNQDIDSHACFIQLNLSISIMDYLGIVPRYRILDDIGFRKRLSLNIESPD